MTRLRPSSGEPPLLAEKESQLISGAREGNDDAFDQLVLAHQGRVYNTAYRILGDHAAAEDATQDTFVSAYRAIRRFRGGSFQGWLLRIATNACYDQIRRSARRPSTSLEALEAEPEDAFLATAESEDPEAVAEKRELGTILEEAILSLPTEQRITLVLVDVQGLDYREAAEATGVRVGTVKSRLSRARYALRDRLQEDRELLPSRYRLKGDDEPEAGDGSGDARES
ncbi:MAG: RNA polymerase sigma factor [Anaerolineae bacterium]